MAAVTNQPLGSLYCRYGPYTSPSYACGDLISKTHLGGMPNPLATTMVPHRDGVDLSSPGDSGGPVYTASSALGIAHSCLSDDVQCDDPNLDDDLTYVAFDYIESGLGVSILTAP